MSITRFTTGLFAALLIACGRSVSPVPDPSAAAEHALRPFLDRAIDEFVHEFGSGTTEKRWESPFVTQELLLLTDMEGYRALAFTEGLSYDRTVIPSLKPPTPRSYWLPIAAEGTYTYSITRRNNQNDTILITVQFHCTVGTKTYSDQIAVYHMVLERGNWRVAEITKGQDITMEDDYSLKRYLTRMQYMRDS